MSNNNPVREQLHQTALKAPSSSGVYFWRNKKNDVIYVGKAKNLKNRLSSYFSGKKDIKTRLLISNASSIEYITTANEYEAFLLENNLIKKYTPKYNIDLKDGKSYPVLRITREEFPRLFKTRNVLHDGSVYFGPYPDAAALDTFIDALYQIYPLRHCRTFKKRDAPCLYYHMGQCKAPCCGKISKDSYNEYFGEISALLEGKGLETPEPTDSDIAKWREIFHTHAKAMGKTTKPKTDNQIRKWLQDPRSDSAEYKMWGNGVALPNVYFVLSGIMYYAQESAT